MKGLMNPSLFLTIEELPFSARAANALQRRNIHYIGELVQKTEVELHFSPKMLKEVRGILAEIDPLFTVGMFTFGMKVDDFPTMLKRWQDEREQNVRKGALDILNTARLRKRPVVLTDDALAEMFKSILILGLPVRCEHSLQAAGIRYVGELTQKTEADLLKIPNFARRFLETVQTKLAELNKEFGLGMQIVDWETELAQYEERIEEEDDALTRLAALETENAVLRGKNELLERLLQQLILGSEKNR